jgi:diguanylate cyclase (GGDEF)-like protein/PAS domain S-box-containing protein
LPILVSMTRVYTGTGTEHEAQSGTADLERRLAFAEAVAKATPDCLYIYDVQACEYRYQNVSVPEFLGYTPEQVTLIERDHLFHVWVGHPDELEDGINALDAQRLIGEKESIQRLFRLRTGDGDYRWYSLRVVSFSRDDDGAPLEVLGLLRDVHEVVASSVRLTESERRFRELFDRSPAGTAIVDDDGIFGEVNDALCAFLGRTRDELIGTSYDLVLHPDERRGAGEARSRYKRLTSGTHRAERRFVRPDGIVRWGRLSVTRVIDEDRPTNLVSLEDVTAVKEVEDRLRHAAMHDMLTGLPNRRMLADRLNRALARRLRVGGHLAVLFVDLDGVKKVNDELGHETGDALLVKVAERLAASLRTTDTVARVGGDEFVVVCPDLESLDEIPEIAERLLDAARVEMFSPDGLGWPLSASASIGVAVATPALDTVEGLLRAADNAMYAAKRAGRDRYVVADVKHGTAIFVPRPDPGHGTPVRPAAPARADLQP